MSFIGSVFTGTAEYATDIAAIGSVFTGRADYATDFSSIGSVYTLPAKPATVISYGTLGSDVISSTDTIVASSGTYPGGEAPVKAIDGNINTKYLNYAGAGTGVIITTTGGPYIVGALDLTSGNDSSSRDPASYEISASNDGSDYTAIASGTVPVFLGRKVLQRMLFTATGAASITPYTYWKVIFPTLVGSSYMQVTEIELIEAPSASSGASPTVNYVYDADYSFGSTFIPKLIFID